MKVSEQTQLLKAELQVVQHSIFNTLAMNIVRRIESQVPGLKLRYGGKKSGQSIISATITGMMEDEDGSKSKQIQTAVDAIKISGPGSLL